MPNEQARDEHHVLLGLIDSLRNYDDTDRRRLLRTVITYFNLGSLDKDSALQRASNQPENDSVSEKSSILRRPSFSDHPDMSPKEFLIHKAPSTDIERVGCLAFYLTHFRNCNHFKTVDISKLNTEAAQAKLSNASTSVDNATKQGFLAPAGKGLKQLSADGERYVDALPDRDAAKEIRKQFSKRRPRRRASKKSSTK